MNLHNTCLSPKAREVTYRLLFNITPVTQKTARKYQTLSQCKLCRQNIQETEDHIYFHCRAISSALNTLKETIQKHTKTHVDIYQAVMLNMIPKTKANMKTKLFRCLGEFRLLAWTCRNKAVYKNRIYNSEVPKHI